MTLLQYVNLGNQRTAVTRTGENTANYTYDAIGQVIADQATEVSGGAARVNEQLYYGFDPAGNLNYRTNNTLIENFQVNSLNELTANTNGGKLTCRCQSSLLTLFMVVAKPIGVKSKHSTIVSKMSQRAIWVKPRFCMIGGKRLGVKNMLNNVCCIPILWWYSATVWRLCACVV